MMTAVHGWKRVAKSLLAFALLLAAAIGVPLVATKAAMAQTYPSQMIKVICGVASGSPIDVTARLVTNDLPNRLGKPVIVENRPVVAARSVSANSPEPRLMAIPCCAGPSETRSHPR
jgi:tripartite-type tricarboxylate transporter receptor subunit TctC